MKNLRITAYSFFLGIGLFLAVLSGMKQVPLAVMIPVYTYFSMIGLIYWGGKYKMLPSIKQGIGWGLIVLVFTLLVIAIVHVTPIPGWFGPPLSCLMFLAPNLFCFWKNLTKRRLTFKSIDFSRKWLEPEVKPILREQFLNSVTKSLDTITKGEELADLPMPEEPLWQMEMEVFKELDQQSGVNLFGPAIEEMEQQLPAFLESKMEDGKLDVKYYIRYPDGCRQLASQLGKLVIWHNDYQVGVLLG